LIEAALEHRCAEKQPPDPKYKFKRLPFFIAGILETLSRSFGYKNLPLTVFVHV
jgi:hypothetical protein